MCGCDGVSWRQLAAVGEGGKGSGGGGGGYLSMVVRKIFCSYFFLPGGRHLVIGKEITPHQLPTTIVTQFCGHTEFLRELGHGKGRVQHLNSNPKVCNTNILIPESQVPLVETHACHGAACLVEYDRPIQLFTPVSSRFFIL